MIILKSGKEAKESIAYTFVDETIETLFAIEKMFRDTDKPELAKEIRKINKALALVALTRYDK